MFLPVPHRTRRLAGRRARRLRGGGEAREQQLDRRGNLGFGGIVVSDLEAPNTLVNLV